MKKIPVLASIVIGFYCAATAAVEQDITCVKWKMDTGKANLASAMGAERHKGSWEFKDGKLVLSVPPVSPEPPAQKTDKPDAATSQANKFWICPFIYSGLKTVTIEATLILPELQGEGVGINFGESWMPAGSGITILIRPTDKKLVIRLGDARLVFEGPVAVVAKQPIKLRGEYSFTGEYIRAFVNDQLAGEVKLPIEPLDSRHARCGRNCYIIGSGIVSLGTPVEVTSFSVTGGEKKRRIVMLGDSITRNHFPVAAIEKRLGEQITNLGIGGDSTGKARSRVATDVIPLKPEFVIIYLGANDPSISSVGNVIATAEQCRAAGIKPVVCTLIPRAAWKQIQPFNAELKRRCVENKIDLVDWYDVMNTQGDGRLSKENAPDGTHVIAAGAAIMAQQMDPGLFKAAPAP